MPTPGFRLSFAGPIGGARSNELVRQTDAVADSDREAQALVPEGLWVKCLGCSAQLYRAELHRNFHVCPSADITFGSARASARDVPRSRSGLRARGRSRAPRPAAFQGHQALPRASRAGSARDRRARRPRRDGRHAEVDADVAAAFEFRFISGRWAPSSASASCAASLLPPTSTAARVLYSERRRANAGRAVLAVADGQDELSARELAAAQVAIHIRNDRSDHGGVSASLALLGDINIAEPGALICFAGPRVIEQTTGETLPEGFQRAEFLLEKGAIDMILDRRQSRDQIAALLAKLSIARRSPSGRGAPLAHVVATRLLARRLAPPVRDAASEEDRPQPRPRRLR